MEDPSSPNIKAAGLGKPVGKSETKKELSGELGKGGVLSKSIRKMHRVFFYLGAVLPPNVSIDVTFSKGKSMGIPKTQHGQESKIISGTPS